MPNTFAFVVLLAWPLFIIYLFKKLPLSKAVIWSMLISFLALPVKTQIDLPLIPPIDKNTLPAITILTIIFLKYKDFKFSIEDNTARRLLLLFILAPVFTIATNTDSLTYGDTFIPALRPYDIISISFINLCTYIGPFLIGRYALNTEDSHRDLITALVLSFAVYCVPILWEIRMSPQLHRNFYGFFPHVFSQQMRGDGFRPVVFLGHGLLVGFYVATVFAAAVALGKVKEGPLKTATFMKVAFIAVVLVISKAIAAMIYGFSMFLVVRFFKPIMHVRIAAILVTVVVIFPVLRTENFIPTQAIVEYIKTKDEDRAQSIEFRFDNEDVLLEKAQLRKYFGWGSWGRNRIWHPVTGQDISVTDGIWIIMLGMFGYTGFYALFGLLAYSVYKVYFYFRKNKSEQLSIYTSVLCLLYAFNLFDLLPNSSISMITTLIGGGLLGYVEKLQRDAKERRFAPKIPNQQL